VSSTRLTSHTNNPMLRQMHRLNIAPCLMGATCCPCLCSSLNTCPGMAFMCKGRAHPLQEIKKTQSLLGQEKKESCEDNPPIFDTRGLEPYTGGLLARPTSLLEKSLLAAHLIWLPVAHMPCAIRIVSNFSCQMGRIV
jgi:hypothetical protein